MATLLLSCRSSQGEPVTLYTAALVTDQRLVADTTSTYHTTQGANEILTPIVATPTSSPEGILHLIILVHFMQEASSSLLLMLKYSTKQQLRTIKQYTVLSVNRTTLEIFKVKNGDDCFSDLFIVSPLFHFHLDNCSNSVGPFSSQIRAFFSFRFFLFFPHILLT